MYHYPHVNDISNHSLSSCHTTKIVSFPPQSFESQNITYIGYSKSLYILPLPSTRKHILNIDSLLLFSYNFSSSFTDNWWNKYKNKLDLKSTERGPLKLNIFHAFIAYCTFNHIITHFSSTHTPYGLHRHLFQAKPIWVLWRLLVSFFKVKLSFCDAPRIRKAQSTWKSLYFSAAFTATQTPAAPWTLPLKEMSSAPHTRCLQHSRSHCKIYSGFLRKIMSRYMEKKCWS